MGRSGLQRGFAAQEELTGIVAYDTIARDLEFIRQWSPDIVIADEAQRIKNWNTIAARALKRIESPYADRWCGASARIPRICERNGAVVSLE